MVGSGSVVTKSGLDGTLVIHSGPDNPKEG